MFITLKNDRFIPMNHDELIAIIESYEEELECLQMKKVTKKK